MRSAAGWLVIALAAAAIPNTAGAHVAPAIEENNRYLKITPLGDRLRLSYTVYLGEIPGARARAQMDENRDGVIDEREAKDYGDALAEQVADGLALRVDGRRHRVRWDDVHVGLGDRSVSGGSFAVDLLSRVCVARAEGPREHTLVLEDRLRLPHPGESELRVDEGPGIRVLRSALGPKSDAAQLRYRWFGGHGPLSSLGYHLVFRVDPDRAMSPREPCREPSRAGESEPASSGPSLRARATGAAVLVLAFAAAVFLLSHRNGGRQ